MEMDLQNLGQKGPATVGLASALEAGRTVQEEVGPYEQVSFLLKQEVRWGWRMLLSLVRVPKG